MRFYSLLILSLLALTWPDDLRAQETTTLIGPDGTTITIQRDGFGVPHITARSEVAVLFGQGYAVAADRLLQLELTRRQSEGRLAEIFGSDAVAGDISTRRELYTAADRRRITASMSVEWRARYQAFADGVNRYLDSMRADPARLMPLQIAQAAMLGLTIEPWTIGSSLAIVQYVIGALGRFGGSELDRLGELNRWGEEYFNRIRPLNDSTVYTTIAPGDGRRLAHRSPEPPPISLRQSNLRLPSEIVVRIDSIPLRIIDAARRAGAAVKLGSFAAVIDSVTSAAGSTLLLGCPQMARPVAARDETNVVYEVELDAPGLHVGGIAVPGIPLIIIGRNEHHAWTLTSGMSDNCDIFLDSASSDFQRYWYKGEWRDVEFVQDTVISQGTPVPVTFLRTVHGPVIDIDTAGRRFIARTTTYREREHDMSDGVLAMSRARSLEEFEAGVRQIPCSYNVLYAGRDLRIGYWHVGRYPLPDSLVDRRLPRLGDGSMDWKGFIAFEDLPQAVESSRGYFVNWNNKPAEWWDNGDAIPWVSNSLPGTLVDTLDAVVAGAASCDFAFLQDIPRRIGDHGTYEQALELSPGTIVGRNIVAPGQSAFTDIEGVPGPHTSDQWGLFSGWSMKEQTFGAASGVVDDGADSRVAGLTVAPNPTRGSARFRLQCLQPGDYVLTIVDIAGREVARATGGTEPGPNEVVWNGRNAMGARVAPGMYLARIRTPDGVFSEKVVVRE